MHKILPLLIGVVVGVLLSVFLFVTVREAIAFPQDKVRLYQVAFDDFTWRQIHERGMFVKGTIATDRQSGAVSSPAWPFSAKIVGVERTLDGSIRYRVYDASFPSVDPASPPISDVSFRIALFGGTYQFWQYTSQDYMDCIRDAECIARYWTPWRGR